MATDPEEVARLAAAAGLALSPERCAVVAGALDAFAPLLDSLSAVDVDDAVPPEVFDARW
jgi:Asp-tRNA(Asn)/Glu-tRNA(Gln) amidotransferase C subunit